MPETIINKIKFREKIKKNEYCEISNSCKTKSNSKSNVKNVIITIKTMLFRL